MKAIAKPFAIAAAAGMLLASPSQAKIPDNVDALMEVIAICAASTDMIVAGKTTEDENIYWRQELKKRGWTDAGDEDELRRMCIVFKHGYIKRMEDAG